MTSHHTSRKGFTLIELLVVIAIIGILSAVVLASMSTSRVKGRDAARISQIRQIQYALALYQDANGMYPACLYTSGCTSTSLEASTFMSKVSKDPLSGLGYSYAALGSGAACSSYHLGASLEDKTNRVLIFGADAGTGTLCTGSAADFSGLSAAAGGQPCVVTAGTAQPGGTETCYDVKP